LCTAFGSEKEYSEKDNTPKKNVHKKTAFSFKRLGNQIIG
jgi:hypothetical protein